MTAPKKETPIEKVVRLAGGPRPLAKALKIRHQFIYVCLARGWFPPKRATQLEELYGVPRKKLINPQLAELLS